MTVLLHNWQDVARKHPKGLIGIVSGNMGRYREFDGCLHSTLAPPGTRIGWRIGVDPTYNLNQLARDLREGEEWLWILGDDHVWTPDLLLRLLERNVDAVAPHCLRRAYPFWHVLHHGKEKGFARANLDCLEGWSGCQEITSLTVGNAGMLIRKRVFDGMKDPWFECGHTHPEVMGSDLYFCDKLADAGFKLYLDLDNPIGHIVHMAVWPKRYDDGIWGADIRKANDVFGSDPVTGEYKFPNEAEAKKDGV